MTNSPHLNSPHPDSPLTDCSHCPRLVAFRQANQKANPHWHNGAVASFGSLDAQLLVVGLAPGLRGANRTGRPFTGDHAGDVLYPQLLHSGFAQGDYQQSAQDGLTLTDCRITNAVRCVPPQNKPEAAEINQCRVFLRNEIAQMNRLRIIIALGTIAHDSLLRALEMRKRDYPFRHGARYQISHFDILASYHCSRYNMNTKRLSIAMFRDIFDKARAIIDNNR